MASQTMTPIGPSPLEVVIDARRPELDVIALLLVTGQVEILDVTPAPSPGTTRFVVRYAAPATAVAIMRAFEQGEYMVNARALVIAQRRVAALLRGAASQ